jgi:carbon monoxide dehydrogenase subunit G
MKVQLDRTFAMPASADATWAMLQDIEAVAACMPGAAITERIDAQHYKGTVALKVGPASLKFKGEIEVKELDAATRTLRLVAKGTDTSGTSAASMDLTARVEAADGGLSTLVGYAEASVSGKVAAFASRMMDAVADQILKQFAANFAARVAAQQPAPAQPPAPPTAAASGAAAGPGPSAAPAPAAQKELNGLALLWAVLKDWLRGLFSKKAA